MNLKGTSHIWTKITKLNPTFLQKMGLKIWVHSSTLNSKNMQKKLFVSFFQELFMLIYTSCIFVSPFTIFLFEYE